MPLIRHVGKVNCEKSRVKKDYEYYEHTWVIRNFRSCYNKVGECHESPEFWTGNYRWTLDIFVDGYSEGAKKYVGLRPFLMNKSDCRPFSEFIIEFCIVNNEGKEDYNQLGLLLKDDLNEDSCVFQRLILKSDLLNNSRLLPDNNLKICCKISFESSSNSEMLHKSEKSITTHPPIETVQSTALLSKLLDDDEFSDFSFVIGEKKFHVHRAILAASSPVFRAMFQSEMLESKERKVYIDDIEPDVIEKLLRFVYIGEAKDLEDVADKVLVAADKYQIDSLKQLCETFLADRVNIDNVYDLLQLADKYSAVKVQNKVMEFFSKNLKKLKATANFKKSVSMLPINLQTDIICAVAEKL